MRTPDLLPDIALVPLMPIKAIDFHHCSDCGEAYPDTESSCPHSRLLCESHRWACRECAVDLEDDRLGELIHDMTKEGA